jgi:hypothetical protein
MIFSTMRDTNVQTVPYMEANSRQKETCSTLPAKVTLCSSILQTLTTGNSKKESWHRMSIGLCLTWTYARMSSILYIAL